MEVYPYFEDIRCRPNAQCSLTYVQRVLFLSQNKLDLVIRFDKIASGVTKGAIAPTPGQRRRGAKKPDQNKGCISLLLSSSPRTLATPLKIVACKGEIDRYGKTQGHSYRACREGEIVVIGTSSSCSAAFAPGSHTVALETR